MSLETTLYTNQQVRELDRIAIEEYKIPGFTLMKRAAEATFVQIQKMFPDSESVCIVCGLGNNGGDGYVIATLAIEAGLKTKLIQLGDQQAIKGDALKARNGYIESGGEILSFSVGPSEVDRNDIVASLQKSDLIVDAIFGIGLSRDIEGEWANIISVINDIRDNFKAKVIAVDIPSGLDSDTGQIYGIAIKADLTVSYIGLKKGLFTGKARDYVGSLKFSDLDVPDEVFESLTENSQTQITSDSIIRKFLPERSRVSHKGSYGHVLVIGGDQGMSGAVRLAGEAALRTGAGLVSIATHPSHAELLNVGRLELMVSGIEQSEALLPLIEKASVIAIGPGLGQSNWAKGLLSAVLKSTKPKILDADALNLISQQEKLPSLKNSILTPHPAEAGRLLGVATNQVEQNRYSAAEKISTCAGAICVLKGAGTLVTDGHKTSVCTAGNPGMASGGMGDTLTGIIASLVAQGVPLYESAELGVLLHAKAADIAAKEGERGMIASDLLPKLRELVNP